MSALAPSALTLSALVMAGGALGALSRFWLSVGFTATFGTHLPVATFVANVVGSAAIGVLAGLALGKGFSAFLIVGLLGGFTTFSAFSLETVRMMEEGRAFTAATYAAASAIVSIAAAGAGLAIGRAAQ
ncbi:MAG: CrcB family protein [Pseudomonadota bacterium]